MRHPHTVLAMPGFIAPCILTSCSTLPAERTPDDRTLGVRRPSGEFDVAPFIALAYTHNPLQTVLLQRMQSSCPQGMRRAVMFDRRAPVVWFGCWRERDGKVEIAFEDGDFIALERARFSWLPEVGT